MKADQLTKPNKVINKFIIRAKDVSVSYSGITSLEEISLDIYPNTITGLIGISGCGKTTFLRCFNRLNELIRGATVDGNILFKGQNIYDKQVNPVELRRQIGMVFQRPNPFPKSIYDNIAIGLRTNGYQGDLDEVIEYSLKQVGLWEEVKGNLKRNALTLSGGQQQRLCLARAIALKPEVLLMDEPCSALDPVSTIQIENLLYELKRDYTIILISHNLKQVARLCDYVAYFDIKFNTLGMRVGHLVEYDKTEVIFQKPNKQATRFYVTGNR